MYKTIKRKSKYNTFRDFETYSYVNHCQCPHKQDAIDNNINKLIANGWTIDKDAYNSKKSKNRNLLKKYEKCRSVPYDKNYQVVFKDICKAFGIKSLGVECGCIHSFIHDLSNEINYS